MNRPLTRDERRLIGRALIHLSTEYTAAAMSKEQTGDGRSARMRMIKQAADAQELAWLINDAVAVEVTSPYVIQDVAT